MKHPLTGNVVFTLYSEGSQRILNYVSVNHNTGFKNRDTGVIFVPPLVASSRQNIKRLTRKYLKALLCQCDVSGCGPVVLSL